MKLRRNILLPMLITTLLGAILLSACGGPAPTQEVADQQGSEVITVYKSPT
ncbi:MAG: hypothetical protein PVG32_21375 [Anaerolineales bacterium]|jgi:hypothetical protein